MPAFKPKPFSEFTLFQLTTHKQRKVYENHLRLAVGRCQAKIQTKYIKAYGDGVVSVGDLESDSTVQGHHLNFAYKFKNAHDRPELPSSQRGVGGFLLGYRLTTFVSSFLCIS